MTTGAGTVLDALLGRPGGRAPRVLAARALDGSDAFSCRRAEYSSDRELARELAAQDVGVLAVERPSPTVVRALRKHPCPLFVVTGKGKDALLEDLPPACRVLGPHARLHVGTGNTIACAAHATELDPLRRALDGVGLALAPTPGWLVDLFHDPRLHDHQVVGYVGAEALSIAWARWSRDTPMAHLLVPLGTGAARVDVPRDPGLGAAVAAHTLERLTGPLFPAPNVLALVARGTAPVGDAPHEAAPHANALWSQARRALPELGSRVGMETPLAELPLQIPTASFMAQACLLRRAEREQLRDETIDPVEPPNPEGVERAEEVLRNAGEVLSDHESKVVLRGFGIEITRQAVASSASGAAQFAERIGFPVVLKAVSPDLRRKREIGAVMLGLETAAAVRRSYASIMHNVEDRAPTARLDGVLVAEMIGPGLDVRCGGTRLADGSIALHGAVVSDRPAPEPSVALAPLGPDDALLLAHATLAHAAPALRRATDPDVRVLAGLLLRLDSLFAATGDRILAVDLNPVRLLQGERGYATLDARILQRAHLEGT